MKKKTKRPKYQKLPYMHYLPVLALVKNVPIFEIEFVLVYGTYPPLPMARLSGYIKSKREWTTECRVPLCKGCRSNPRSSGSYSDLIPAWTESSVAG